MIASILLYFILPCLFLTAGIFDLLTGRIPDWINLTLIFGYAIFALSSGSSLNIIVGHISTGILIFFIGFIVFSLGWAGGGDGKLAAVGALWFGPTAVLDFLSLSFICGGALLAIAFFIRRVPLPEYLLRQLWLQRWIGGQEGLPFGLAMAAGVLFLRQIGFDLPTQ